MKQDVPVWVTIGVFVVVVGAILWFAGMGSSNPTTSVAPVTTTSNTPVTPSPTTNSNTGGTKPVVKAPAPVAVATKYNGVDTINHLITVAGQYKCSFTSSTPYVSRVGTMYLDGSKMRADFTSSGGGVVAKVSMIDNANDVYTWKSTDSVGLKVLATVSASGSAIVTHGGIDPATSVSFKCNPWTPDASVFTPPASLSFVDSTGAKIQ